MTKNEEKAIKARRSFPIGKTVLFVVVLAFQIGLIAFAFSHAPQPQDIIKQYTVTVEPQKDGSLDITYAFHWQALDPSEALTWVEIGMANSNFSVYPSSVQGPVSRYEKEVYDGGQVYLRLDLRGLYIAGQELEFSFKVNQKDMLCKDENGYFYSFVPCWFNSTPVENYTFRWIDNKNIQSVNSSEKQGIFHVWKGSFDCGDYTKMEVRYNLDHFEGCDTVPYKPFKGSGAHNELKEDKIAGIIVAFIVAGLFVMVQVWAVDSVVSYHRGRGFLTGHGHYVHTHGRSNPRYIRARSHYHATHGGHSGGRSGGCACACACACAGGGRAGCSQKDTYSNNNS